MSSYTLQKTGNPAFNMGALAKAAPTTHDPDATLSADHVTIEGTAIKSALLVGLAVAAAFGMMAYYLQALATAPVLPQSMPVVLIASGLLGFVVALYTIFVPSHSPV